MKDYFTKENTLNKYNEDELKILNAVAADEVAKWLYENGIDPDDPCALDYVKSACEYIINNDSEYLY